MHSASRTDWAAFDPAVIPTKAETPQLTRWLEALPEGVRRCLDIGCGAGASARRMLERGLSVVGIDINALAVTQLMAAMTSADAQFYQRDVASADGFQLGAELFDAAVCQLVASVVGDAEDRAALLRNTHAALRAGAPLFISFSGLSDDLNADYAALYARDAAETGEHASYFSRSADGRVLYRTHHFSTQEIEHLLREHGFENIRIDEQIESSSRRPEQRARFYYVSCARA